MNGLSKNTNQVFDSICQYPFLKEYYFIGGSAFAVQLNHRLSEDLDFCKWKRSRNDVNKLNISEIDSYLTPDIKEKNIFGFNQVDYYMNNQVRISFYANELYQSLFERDIYLKENVIAADIESIGVMKLELMLRRSSFRDYYDIYSILREGVRLKSMIYRAGKYTSHKLKSKNILMFISNSNNYRYDAGFEQLVPKYAVSGKDIENYIKQKISEEYSESIH